MTLQEAIKHSEDKAKENEQAGCVKCAAEHRQLAGWLKDYERLKKEEINKMKYRVCCPLCDNEKCVISTDKCKAEIWAKRKKRKIESEEIK